MSNNLKQAKKDLKAFAKRAKHVKYTESLLFSYLITGMITFSIGINTSSDVLYERMNKELVMSAEKTRTAIKKKKKANKESIEDLNLELIQLMEQGDQVIKSKWDSWQFGSNTFVSRNNGAYKGRGDKASKYPFVGIYNRGNWGETAALSNRRRVLNPAINSSSVGSTSYGLASLLHVQEPEVEIQIMANVRPKSVLKEEITITPQIDMPREVVRPAINLGVTTPIAAPTILLPTLNPVAIEVAKIDEPGAPSKVDPIDITMKLDAPQITLNITPPTLEMEIKAPGAKVNTITITPPNVSEVSTITVNKPAAPAVNVPAVSVNPINFEVPQLEPYANNQYKSRSQNVNLIGKTYTLSDNVPNRGDAAIVEYITNSGEFTTANNTVMIVDIPGRRAVTLDPGLPSTKGGNMEEGGGIPNPTYSFVNSGTIRLISKNTAGIEVQPDTHPGIMRATGINKGTIQGENERQVALLFTDEDSKAGNEHTLKNGATGLINMTGDNSAGFATSNFVGSPRGNTNNQKSWQMTAINEGTINLSGNKSHGMVVTKIENLPGKIDGSGNFVPTAPKYELAGDSKFENNGIINVNGNDSGGMTILDKVPRGATNNKEINITGNNSFGLYSQDVFNSNLTKVVANETPIVNSASGTITIKGNATRSMGIRVGNNKGNPTGLKNEGTITIESGAGENIGIFSETSVINNDGTIEVKGDKNIGMLLKETKSDTNDTSGNKKKITIDGTNGFGVMLVNNDNKAEFINYTGAEIKATGENSMGMYTKDSVVKNENGATISSEKYHSVVQDGGTFTNEGTVSTEAGGKVALYSENGTFTNTTDGVISTKNGGIAMFVKDSTGTVAGKINVGDSANGNTGIGVYLDAASSKTVTFSGAELKLGKGTVGLYAEDADKFGTGFAATNLKAEVGEGAALAYFGAVGTGTISGGILSNITSLKMGPKSTLLYGDKNSTIVVNDNFDMSTYTDIDKTAQFLVSDQGTATINASKTIKTNLKTTVSGLSGADVTNKGTIEMAGTDESVGIYLKGSTGTNETSGKISVGENQSIGIYGIETSVLTNKGTIETEKEKSVGMLGNASTIDNVSGGTIETKGEKSAGIYGTNESTITNEGTITAKKTGSAGIYADDSQVTNKTGGIIDTEEGKSAGIYAIFKKAKNIENSGTINVGTSSSPGTETQGIGIYAKLDTAATGNLKIENKEAININIQKSIGIYAQNETGSDGRVTVENSKDISSIATANGAIGIMAKKAKVTNMASTGKIELGGKTSVGIYGIENSELKNFGSILLTNTATDSASVGMMTDGKKLENDGIITMSGGASAGMIGKDGATIKNNAAGTITIKGEKSAAIYTENSTPSNAGTINIEGKESSGIFAKNTDNKDYTIENTGTINLKGTATPPGTQSAGIYAEIGPSAGKTTVYNKNKITVGQENSVGIYIKNDAAREKGEAINTGTIDLNVESTVGIFVNKAIGENRNIINVKDKSSAGMYGSNDSVITNKNEINVSSEDSAGMYALDSNATNTSTGKITLTASSGASSGSAGMYGKLSSSSVKDYTVLNEGEIKLTSVTKNVGIYGQTDKAVSKTLTLQNDKKIIIEAGSPESVGIFAVNEDSKNRTLNTVDKLKAINNDEITSDSLQSIGISAVKSTVGNSGTITMNKKESAGIYGKWSSEVTNNKNINMKEKESAGIYLENSNATNATDGTITIDKGVSAGIYGKFTSDAEENNTIINDGKIILSDTAGEVKSAGIYGELLATAAKKLTIKNNKKIEVNMEESVGIYAKNGKDKADLVATNAGDIDLKSEKAVGMLADKATINNKKNITITNKQATGMYGTNGAEVNNAASDGVITISAPSGGTDSSSIGIYVTGNATAGTNNGIIAVNGKKGTGMLATANAKIVNNKSITGSVESVIGMYGVDSGTEVINKKDIELSGKKSTGIFAKDDAEALNKGKILLKSTSNNSVGMFGVSSGAGKKITLTNDTDGTIDVESEKSTGMFTKNDGNLTDSTVKNEGIINLKTKNTVGIYTPKSDVQKVGRINLEDDAESSVAVYLSEEAKADASTGIIDLKEKSQSRVAYYIKGTSATDTGKLYGANIGTIKGYGVGVYLDGGTLDGTTPKLDYTSGSTGNGIIGLLMKGASADISAYTQGIKVGNSVLGEPNDFYAIGIYTDEQGTSGTPKAISADVTTGANGVGLFAENSSHITYTGTMNIGANGTAGTGIYIGNGGVGATKASTVTIENGSKIKLNGTNGVGAIVTSDATVNFNKNSVIEFGGDGVGIFGQKGAHINDNGGTLVTNGHSVERIRVTEGKSETKVDLTLETGNIMSHVINGEAIVNAGVTVDSKVNSKNIIALMADGNKNPSPSHTTWIGTPGYDAENNGKIDLSNAVTSTAMYLDSSRGINNSEIIMGDKSTGIYGIYKNSTSVYSDALPGTKNTGIITTTANSKITIGNESSAIYAIGFDKVENNGEIEGKDKSVGIYAKNTTSSTKPVNVNNTGDITLGKGSAGIYISPEISTATVVNSGNITVGDSTLNSSGDVESTSVGIFVKNKTNLTTTGDVTVGNKGFTLYGNDSTINVNGGNYDFSNSGSLAYLENNAVLNYNNSGTLTTSSEPMLYIINSKANMNNNDIIVTSKGTGIYMNGVSTFSGWNNMTLNDGSTGIYADNSDATVTGRKITGTSDKAKGIVARNSSVTNNANMDFSNDDSIGIFSQNKSSAVKNIVNNGNINITGKRSIAAYLEGTMEQTFENTGTINVDKTTTSVKNDSTVGIYAQSGSKINVKNSGKINVDEASFGIYSLSENGNIETTGTSVINVADKAIGVYKKAGTANLGGIINVADHNATDVNSEPVGVYGTSGVTITDNTSIFKVGDKSYGVILANPGLSKTNVYSNSSSSKISLGKESTFIYTEGKSQVTNNGTITSGKNNGIIAIYGKDGANIVNNGTIDLSQGIGNQGMLVTGASSATNRGTIKIGKTDKSDPNNIIYGIGMAAIDGASATNTGDIYVSGNLSIGMYGDKSGTTLRNDGNIYLDASGATSTDKIQTMMGVFANNGTTFVNKGTITTVGSYVGNGNVQGLVGVAVLNGSTLENYGTINIDADTSYGVLIKGTENNKSIIKNYGNINISGLKSYGVRYDGNSKGVTGNDLPIGDDATPANTLPAINSGAGKITSSNGAQDYYAPKDPSKTIGGTGIVQLPDGRLAIQRNGVLLDENQVQVIDYTTPTVNYALSNFGVYVDTLGRTRPINLDRATDIGINSDLLIGTEFSVLTNKKDVIIGKQILQPFLNQINAGIFNFTPYSASLTWMATPEVDPTTQQITRVLMAKIPYTAFVGRTANEFNFADGLEQRYDANALDSREKLIFNKLNTIGNNEEALLAQSYDEMMGHQYANVQQRIFETGNLLNKEFDYLRREWDTKTKNSNKIKTFGMKGNYKTDTAGIIDYKNKAYGFAYLHENETVKLGEASGWYAGAIKNKFDFNDIGGSKEEQSIVKAGAFKSMPIGKDYNNGLNWTISAEGFMGNGETKRKFLVVDNIFDTKSDFHSFGFAMKNEIRKNIRTSERTSISPYGSLKLEYGRFNGIKEDNGQMRLEVKANDYYSVKPEIGVEFKYKKALGTRTTLIAKVGAAYENELGQVGNVNNKARVRYTSADYFNIKGEKDDRIGNGKLDFNFGIENTRLGITVNAGYDTKGKNVRGGIGLKAIY
ncbi:autotransporter-associated N-terminal domain-containing protein [Leptotrichia buccalis]